MSYKTIKTPKHSGCSSSRLSALATSTGTTKGYHFATSPAWVEAESVGKATGKAAVEQVLCTSSHSAYYVARLLQPKFIR